MRTTSFYFILVSTSLLTSLSIYLQQRAHYTAPVWTKKRFIASQESNKVIDLCEFFNLDYLCLDLSKRRRNPKLSWNRVHKVMKKGWYGFIPLSRLRIRELNSGMRVDCSNIGGNVTYVMCTPKYIGVIYTCSILFIRFISLRRNGSSGKRQRGGGWLHVVHSKIWASLRSLDTHTHSNLF